jgi:hypothetical protein
MQTSTGKAGGKPFDGSSVAGEAPKAVPETLLRKLLLVDDEPDGAEFAAVLLRSKHCRFCRKTAKSTRFCPTS